MVIAGYFILGGIITYCFFVARMGLGNIINYLVPTIIATLVFSFYIGGTMAFVSKPMSINRRDLFLFILFLQSIKLQIFGFLFNNSFGPYLQLIMQKEDSISFEVKWNLFALNMTNGFTSTSSNNLFAINVFNVLFIVLVLKLTSKLRINEIPR